MSGMAIREVGAPLAPPQRIVGCRYQAESIGQSGAGIAGAVHVRLSAGPEGLRPELGVNVRRRVEGGVAGGRARRSLLVCGSGLLNGLWRRAGTEWLSSSGHGRHLRYIPLQRRGGGRRLRSRRDDWRRLLWLGRHALCLRGLCLHGLLDYEVEVVELRAGARGVCVVSADERQEKRADQHHCYAEGAPQQEPAEPGRTRSVRVCGLVLLMVGSHARVISNWAGSIGPEHLSKQNYSASASTA